MATSKLRFLLRCRSNVVIPIHIQNLYKQYYNVSFFSKSCKRDFHRFNNYSMKKLLNFEISDINFHLIFLKKSLKKIDKDISTNTIDSNTKKKISFFLKKSLILFYLITILYIMKSLHPCYRKKITLH